MLTSSTANKPPLPAVVPARTTARRPGLRVRWLGRVWALHRWLGLLFALPLVVISVTGAVLVRYDWVERVADPALFRAVPAGNDDAKPLPLRTQLQAVAAARPGAPPRFVELPGEPGRNVAVSVFGPGRGERRTVILDAATGAVLRERAEGDGPRRWLLRLHDSLLLGFWGEVLVALSAVVLLAAALSGLWIYRGAWRGLWRPRFRWASGNARLWMGDLHKFVGVASLAPLLIWAVTGGLLTLPSLLRQVATSGDHERLEPNPRPAAYDWVTAPAVEPLLDAARARFPGARLDYLGLPARAGDPFTVSLIAPERWLWAKFKEVEFDAADGRLTAARDFAEATALERFNFTVTVLHFGHQGGAAMRWTWFVVGFAPVALAASGGLLWWRRRRANRVRRPAATPR